MQILNLYTLACLWNNFVLAFIFCGKKILNQRAFLRILRINSKPFNHVSKHNASCFSKVKYTNLKHVNVLLVLDFWFLSGKSFKNTLANLKLSPYKTQRCFVPRLLKMASCLWRRGRKWEKSLQTDISEKPTWVYNSGK